MALDTRMVGIIQQGVNSEFWTEYLLPLLRECGKNALDALATKAADDDDMKRGQYQAYKRVMNAPYQEIALWTEQEKRAQETNEAEQTAEYRADYGFRSPIRQAPEVGETTGEAGNAA